MGLFHTIYINRTVGINVDKFEFSIASRWIFSIRYRTLFILATIPWLITLIRLIRSWKKNRAMLPEAID